MMSFLPRFVHVVALVGVVGVAKSASVHIKSISSCTDHVDPAGCRANHDFNNVALNSSILSEQIVECSALCCASDECDAWAVRENYTAGWAHNCLPNKNCCLLKHKGWAMQGNIPGCTSGGKEVGPPVPPPPPPPPSPSPTAPLPFGGGACSSDWNCSLGGECTKGVCACDPQYTGSHCGVMRLRRAKVDNGIQAGSIANHTWGGHAIKDKSTGKYVGFFSYMAGHCGLSSWQSDSMIIKAVADAPDGPYDQNMTSVLPPWSHNAMISQHPNGSYLLFHIGEGKAIKPYSPCSSQPDPFFPFPAGVPTPDPSTTHISESLNGPWRPAPGVPGINNPCPFYFPNGTTLLFDRTTVRWASTVDAPTNEWQSKTSVAVNGNMVPEDPGVWRDKRGNFHMLFNANSGHHNCASGVPCGGHTWSLNGLDWAKPTIPAFGPIVHYNNGTTMNWGYVERPQVLQDDSMQPLTLFLGQSYAESHSLAIMFCQATDSVSDCVNTVQ